MPEFKEKTIDKTPDYSNIRGNIPESLGMLTASGPRALLLWSRQQTEGYNDVNIYNMTSSWRDGLAFCAIIHRYRPDLVDFEKLTKENIVENNELAFNISERHFEIQALLDVADLVENPVPDKLTVISYVSQLFNYFKDKTPANQSVSTKMITLPKSKDSTQTGKPSKRVSPSQQIYALSGKAKKISSALRNVFRSDSKEEQQAKIKEAIAKQASCESLKTVPENVQTKNTEDAVPAVMQCLPSLGKTCTVCLEKVFIMERLVAERKLFHRACFKCHKCNSGLRSGTYTYFPDIEKFCCLYECMGVAKNKQDDIKIKLQPITDNALRMAEQLNSREPIGDSESRRSSMDTASTCGDSSLHSSRTKFSVVKRNAISIGSLPNSFDEPSRRRPGKKGRSSNRRSTERRRNHERSQQGNKGDEKKGSNKNQLLSDRRSGKRFSSPLAKRKVIGPDAVEVNGKVKSSIQIIPEKPRESPSRERKQIDNDENQKGTQGREHDKTEAEKEERHRRFLTLNDAYNREVEELPQEGGVQKLLSKFKNIDDMIESKHKQNVAKKNKQIRREIKNVVPSWKEQTESIKPPSKKRADTTAKSKRDTGNAGLKANRLRGKYHGSSLSTKNNSDDSLSTSSELSSTSQTDLTSEATTTKSASASTADENHPSVQTTSKSGRHEADSQLKVVYLEESPRKGNTWRRFPSPRMGRKNKLSVPSEDSSSSPSTSPSPSPTRKTIPIFVRRPSVDCEANEEGNGGGQASHRSSTTESLPNRHLSDASSIPDSLASPACSGMEMRWPSQNSLADTSSSCSSPRMSIIISQEPSSTKINSRYFTVETCENTFMDDDTILEEVVDIDTVVIEGEFRFGRERTRFSKAQREALKSLRNLKITRQKSELVKEEEVNLSQEELTAELKALETLHSDLEKRGVEMEKLLRKSMDFERPLDGEDELLREWLTLIHEKNVILRRESELIYLMQFHQYEDRYWAVECELRALVSMRDEVKSSDDIKRERELLAELLRLVQKRSFIVDSLEEDRIREKQEDENIKQVMEDGINEPPADTWDQKQDYTKVAFSRFYC